MMELMQGAQHSHRIARTERQQHCVEGGTGCRYRTGGGHLIQSAERVTRRTAA